MALTDENKVSGVIDLNIEGIKKTPFRINGRDDSILELNTSDLGIAERLEKGYENIQKELQRIAALGEDADLSAELKKADKVMRDELDYIFDSNVSEVCGKGGTMYDPINGSYRFELIINALTNLYSTNLNDQYKKMKARIQKHTEKYVNTKSGKSGKRG